MTDYRRNFIAGGSFFFTINLAERRRRLLTEHIAELRAAFRHVRRQHPFEIDAMSRGSRTGPIHRSIAWYDAEFIRRIGRAISPIWMRSSASGCSVQRQCDGYHAR